MVSRIRWIGGLGAWAAALVAGQAWADVKSGVDAWSKGDFSAAVAAWQDTALQNNPDAQFNLAQAYRLGRGVKSDLAKAEELFGKAAAQGHVQASDNYGLLLFQRGERAKALPYITAASDRGEPRAQYLLGIASFNGDNVPKDWVRAYALVSLAQQAGLQQAVSALAQMDQHVPLAQRQQSVALAQELKLQADATRTRQLASVDLGNSVPNPATTRPAPPVVTSQPRAMPTVMVAAPAPHSSPPPASPRDAGADYARPRPAAPASSTAPAPRPPVPASPVAVAVATSRPAAPRPAAAIPAPAVNAARAATPSGAWRAQLGAFGVAANAQALWDRVKNRPELAGHAKVLVPAGKVTKLQAGGFASQATAQAACARLAAGGIACLAVPN